MFSERFGWQPISTAPIDTDVKLIVTDGGEPYAVLKPFKLTSAGWVSSGKGTPLAVTPLHWKPTIHTEKRPYARRAADEPDAIAGTSSWFMKPRPRSSPRSPLRLGRPRRAAQARK
jgi:hypothetical protein